MRQGSTQALTAAESDHRCRLTTAMVEAASEHGYRGATVSQVIERAGVSRATFYELFSGRDQCFLVAYREEVARIKSVMAAAAELVDRAEQPGAVLDVLVSQLADDPAVARFLLVEALAAPTSIREGHEALIADVDRLVTDFLDEHATQAAIQIPATALVAGVIDALAREALTDTVGDLEKLRNDLAGWIASYQLPEGETAFPQAHWRDLGRFARLVPPIGSGEPVLLPRGRSALPEEQVAGERRGRILDATARLCREKGYASLTVSQIAAAARVPRAAFYSHFESKQAALMAAQTRGLQESMSMAAAEYSPAGPWPLRVWKMARAFLTYLAERPDYAHLDFVESYAAGSEAVRHRQQNHMVFALFLEDGYRHNPDAPRPSGILAEAIAGGVLGLIRRLVVAGRAERMLSLLPAAVYTILAPFIGPQDAAAQVQDLARGAR